MLTIFKKEFRSFFRRGTGFIFLAISAFFIGLLSIKHSFAVSSAQFELSLHELSICFAVFLPLLSLRIFSKDKNERTDKLLLALSFKPSQIVFGKYLAMLSFVAIGTVILAVFPIVLGFFGKVNYLASYLSIAVFFIFCATILALCTFISAAMTDSLTSATLSYVLIAFGYLLGRISIEIPFGALKTVLDIANFLSPFSHIEKFAAGIFKLDSIIYFVLLTALFLFLALRQAKKNEEVFKYGKNSREARRFALSPVLAVILTVCTISVSALSSFIPAKYCDFDMYPTVDDEQPIPDDLLGELSSETMEFISAIETNVRIYILNPDDSEKSIENFVLLYGENSDKITVLPTKAEDIADKLIPLGWDGVSAIAPYTLVIESDKGEDRTQVISPSSFYYYSHADFGDMDYDTFSYYYSLLSQYAAQDASYAEMLESLVTDTVLRSSIEQLINSTIEYGIIDIIPRPYFLTGHGEPSADASTLRQAFLSFGFSFDDLDLTSSDKLPEDASVIIINTPTSDISKKEADIISEFLKNGGSMSLITNEKNLEMPNLMSLVNAYGVSAKPGFVSYDYELEAEASESESAETDAESSNEEETADKHIVEAFFNDSHEATAPLEGYSTGAYYANHIEISSVLDDNVIVIPVLTTDENCVIDGVENSEGIKNVAVAIQTKDIENPTKIVWFTGGDAFDGENLYEMNAYGSIYSIIWGVDDYESTIKEVEPKTIDLSFIQGEDAPMIITEKTTTIVNVIFVAAIPTIFAIFAIIMLVKFSKAPSKTATVQTEEIEETDEESEE